MEGRYGVAPGEDIDAARSEFEAAVAAAASHDEWLADHPPTVEWWGGTFLPGRTDPDDRIVHTVHDAIGTVSPRRLPIRGMPYGCDLGLLDRVGAIPTVVFGPGDVRAAHRPNEHVPIADLIDCASAIALSIVRFLS
jgi:acetylornithine deacetylase